MPRYRFTAVDSYGTPHDGTIDAATEADARNKLASNGLAVRSVEEAAGAPGMPAPELPRRPAPRPAGMPGPQPARAPAFEPAERTEPRRGSVLPLVFSLLALLVSVGTAVYTLTRDPTRNRLSKYDLRTPEAAFRSSVEMMAKGDAVAFVEYQLRGQAAEAGDSVNSLVIDPKMTDKVGDRSVIYVEYYRKGEKRREVHWFEQDSATGLWRPSFGAEFRMGANEVPPQVAQKIQNWRQGGVGGRFGVP